MIVDHRIAEARLIGRIMDRRGEVITQQQLASETASEFVFASKIGSLRWIDDETVELQSKDRLSNWRFAVTKLVAFTQGASSQKEQKQMDSEGGPEKVRKARNEIRKIKDE